MKRITYLLTTILISYQANADQISYNFDYALDEESQTSIDPRCNDLEDPFQVVNRKIFFFNSFLDYITLKPMAKAYNKFTNETVRSKVGNFVDNIQVPLTTVNYALQGNLKSTVASFWRFMFNTILGIGGINDVASKYNIENKPQTFGSTLAHYGASPGPYVVLPILGGTNMRDMWDGIAFDDALNPIKHNVSSGARLTYSAIRLVHKRDEIMPFTDYISKNSTDPYSALRSAMHQKRESVVHYPEGYKCGVRASRLKNKSTSTTK